MINEILVVLYIQVYLLIFRKFRGHCLLPIWGFTKKVEKPCLRTLYEAMENVQKVQ